MRLHSGRANWCYQTFLLQRSLWTDTMTDIRTSAPERAPRRDRVRHRGYTERCVGAGMLGMFARDPNRRAAPRYPVEYRIRAQSCALDPTVRISGYSRDISMRGIQLRTDHPVPLDSRILLTLEHRDDRWDHVSSCAGTVVWVTPMPDQDAYLLGVRCAGGESPLMAYSWTARPVVWMTDPLTGLILPRFFARP